MELKLAESGAALVAGRVLRTAPLLLAACTPLVGPSGLAGPDSRKSC